jgi:metal-responsive CopG/Arc/MetJ family transcriptional regulator
MSTTVHIPPELLERIDARARSMGLSRNKLIVQALRRDLDRGSDWSPEFLQALDSFGHSTSPEIADAADEMLDDILSRRSPPRSAKRTTATVE